MRCRTSPSRTSRPRASPHRIRLAWLLAWASTCVAGRARADESPRGLFPHHVPRLRRGRGPGRPDSRSHRAQGPSRCELGRDARSPRRPGSGGAGRPSHAARRSGDRVRRLRSAGDRRDPRGHGRRHAGVPGRDSTERRRRRHRRPLVCAALAHRSHRDLSRRRAARGRPPGAGRRGLLRAEAAHERHGRRRLLRGILGREQGLDVCRHTLRARGSARRRQRQSRHEPDPFVDDHGTEFEPQNDTTGTRENADEATLDGWSLARVALGRGATLDVVANAITREQGVPSLALVQTREARERVDRGLVGVATSVPLGRAGRATLDAQTSLLVGSTAFSNPLLELPLQTRELRIVGRRIEQTIGATVDVSDALRIRPIGDGLGRRHRAQSRRHPPRQRAPRVRAPRGRRRGARRRAGSRSTPSAAPSVTTRVPTPTWSAMSSPRRAASAPRPGRAACGCSLNVGRYVRVPTLGEVYGVSEYGPRKPGPRARDRSHGDLGVRAQTGRGGALEGAYVDAFVFARWADGPSPTNAPVRGLSLRTTSGRRASSAPRC